MSADYVRGHVQVQESHAVPSRGSTEVAVDRAVRTRKAVAAAVACRLCPHIAPERGIELLTAEFSFSDWRSWFTGTASAQGRASQLVSDPAWREPALAWVDAYNRNHGHGPTWGEFRREESIWTPPWDAVTTTVRRITLPLMSRAGHLDGMKTPFGMRRAIAPGESRDGGVAWV
ncbi:hypothetical protein [Streptomyces sp. V1I1]|uniref:hypothetical protein n=1 Tax=Streptomyces sp. V1I1 TaxID=3042272 RepID=UPI0027876DBD|nr:hypothetical protein [Streptomyces sp. V1I1]MDQ0945979.1 hypothetical protein [Streptomyces sp. V1I1]